MDKAKQYPTDKPVVFGSRKLFEKLCKNHLTGKVRERLKKRWRELRQGALISIGSKTDKGNRLTRFEDLNGQLCLRITIGNREFIYAKVLEEPSNKNVQNAKKLLTHLVRSLQSEPSSCKGANGRNSAWLVLKVALLFPILGKVLPRALSPLKPILVEGAWDRVRSRLVPLSAGGRSR